MIRAELKEDEITAALERLARSLTDMTPLMQDLGELMVASTKDNFRTGTDPEGNAWAPRSPATLEAYARRKDRPGPRPLIGPSRALGTTISFGASPTSVEWGSNMIYSAVMQMGAAKGAFGTTTKGSSIPWGNIPARPYLGIGPHDRTNILATITEYLERAARGD